MSDQQIAQLRVPPHSIEAESSVLGAILLDNEALHRVPGLTTDAFYRLEHRELFREMQAMASAGKSWDPVTTYEWMRDRGLDRDGNLLAYLNSLAQYVPSAANIRRYAEIVIERHTLRQIIATADEVATSAFNMQGKTVPQVVNDAQMAFAKIATVKARREPQHIRESMVGYLDLLQAMSEGKNPAISTGIGGLDRVLNGGLRRGEMMVLGARPKHGKTALSLALARNIARRYSVLFISQEMPIFQLMHRHTAALGSIDLGSILRADPTDTETWEGVNRAAERMGELHLVHDEQSAQSLLDIRRKAVKVKREHGLDVLFVDFLQLMQGAGEEESRNRELDVIVNGIKALAMDLDIATVVLSQMTRKADEHYSRPSMTFLRDSGAIEAAADQVALLFTDHAHPMSPKKEEFAGLSELEIVAHRNGPCDLVPLHFIGRYQQMGDWGGDVPQRTAGRSERGMK